MLLVCERVRFPARPNWLLTYTVALGPRASPSFESFWCDSSPFSMRAAISAAMTIGSASGS